MKFLITGKKGQLARSFCCHLKKKKQDFVAFDRCELDITNFEAVKRKITEERPQVFINCSAYNLVDLAETFPHTAYKVNTHAVQNIASLCAEYHIKLIHFSSDYVFDGRSKTPYTECMRTSPINVYGLSKCLAEKAIMETAVNYLIFRTSWVYGVGKQNFIYKFLTWAKERQSISVAYDEVSIPTSVETITNICLAALEKDMTGLYHLTSSGWCSRYEFAVEISKLLKVDKKIIPVSKGSFNSSAKRGDFLVLDNAKIAKDFEIPCWQSSLFDYISLQGFNLL